MVVMYFDGACSGNPGPGGWGYVIKDESGEIMECGSAENTTNNQMEYMGLIRGMEKALQAGIKELYIKGDSQLVINQMKGKYRVKDKKLLPLYLKAKRLESEFESVVYEWIPRKVEYEEIHIEAPSYEELTGEVKPKQIKDVEVPEEGDVIEVFPSPDGLEMIFLVFRKYENGYVELLPMNKFWELGTPEDVLVNFEGERYIVQTDLGIDVPEENFSKRFGNRKVFLLGKLTPQQMKEIEDVYEGRKKGIGNMQGGPKGEFKKLESRRYFSLFAQMIEEEEFFLPPGTYQYEIEYEYAGKTWKGTVKTKGENLPSLCFKVFEKEKLLPVPSGIQWIEKKEGSWKICLYEEHYYGFWLITLKYDKSSKDTQ